MNDGSSNDRITLKEAYCFFSRMLCPGRRIKSDSNLTAETRNYRIYKICMETYSNPRFLKLLKNRVFSVVFLDFLLHSVDSVIKEDKTISQNPEDYKK